MAQNSTSPCSFNTLGDVFITLQTKKSTIGEIAELCPNVCTLAYGNGNPDLSGQGMMSCYMLDVAFSLLCGPTYTISCWYYRRKTNEKPKIKPELQKLFFEAQGLFTLPVLVAAVVRIEQSPPLFEVAFLQYLNWTLAFSLYTTFLSLFYSLRKWPMVFYTCCNTLLQITLLALSESPQVIPENGREIIDHCAKHSAIAPSYFGQDWSLQLGVGFIVIGITGAIPAITYLYFRLHKHPFKWKPVFQIYGICCAGMALYGATQLFFIRNVMKNATGSSFADDQWGFGQVAAVFMWVPWTIQSVEHIYSALKPSRGFSSTGDTSSLERHDV